MPNGVMGVSLFWRKVIISLKDKSESKNTVCKTATTLLGHKLPIPGWLGQARLSLQSCSGTAQAEGLHHLTEVCQGTVAGIV